MTEEPRRPQKLHRGILAVAVACAVGLLLLPILFGLGMGRVLAEIWVTVMAALINLTRALFGAG